MSIYSAFTKVENFHDPNDGRAIFNGEIEYIYDNLGLGVLDGLTVTGDTSLQRLSATTIFSGSTNLYDIFLTTADGNDITRVHAGSNITTGGTANDPIVSVVASPVFNGLTVSGNTSIQTLSATTIYSAGTDLYNIFSTSSGSGDITRVQPGTNIYTGGTDNFPTINLSAATLTYLSATTISATTLFSGSTNLYDIFLTSSGSGVTQYQSQTLINTNGILTISVPANHEIKNIIIKETSGSSAGDISIGTSAMAYDIIHDETIGANTVVYATLGFTFFSLVAPQNIYISSSAWGSGVVTIYLKTERAT